MKPALIIGIVIVAVLAVIGVFAFKKASTGTGKGFSLSDLQDAATGLPTATGLQYYNTTRAPGQSFDNWYEQRKASGWNF